MIKVLYEDKEILVVEKPIGVESQSARRFAPDMVSEVKKYLVIHKSCTPGREPYVGVIHRLDKPVSGIMVYAKTKTAAAALSSQVQTHQMKKMYLAVVCGKPVNLVDKYVDYLVKSPDGNESKVVDKGIKGAKEAELSFEVIKTLENQEDPSQTLSLLRISLKTGRHHQIRVQMASRKTPIYGDARYGNGMGAGENIALCAASLSFFHPVSGKKMTFEMEPKNGIFGRFLKEPNEDDYEKKSEDHRI